jgi:hypothetical protein
MERKHIKPIPHDKREGIGIPTGLLNCNKEEILTGDYVKLKDTDISGPVLYNRYQECFGIFYGCWYSDKNPLNPDSYGKFISIPTDQGMRMELIPVDNKNDEGEVYYVNV